MQLSGSMKDALAIVPDDWQPVKKGFRLGREFVRHPLFQRTFTALKKRNLIEMRGGPGAWEWRRVPIASQ